MRRLLFLITVIGLLASCETRRHYYYPDDYRDHGRRCEIQLGSLAERAGVRDDAVSVGL